MSQKGIEEFSLGLLVVSNHQTCELLYHPIWIVGAPSMMDSKLPGGPRSNTQYHTACVAHDKDSPLPTAPLASHSHPRYSALQRCLISLKDFSTVSYRAMSCTLFRHHLGERKACACYCREHVLTARALMHTCFIVSSDSFAACQQYAGASCAILLRR